MRYLHPPRLPLSALAVGGACLLMLGLTQGGVSAQPSEAPRALKAEALSLRDLLTCARSNNPAWEIAHAQLEEYRSKLRFAQGSALPSLKIASSLAPLPARRMLRYCVGDEPGLQEVFVCPNQEINDDQRLNQVDGMGIWTRTQLTITQPLYTFGKISNGRAAARAGVEAYRAGLERAERALDLKALQIYYGLQLATQVDKTLKRGQAKLKAFKSKVERSRAQEEGRYDSVDLAKIKIQEGDLTSRQLETQALKRQALESVRVACLLPDDAKIGLDSTRLKPLQGEVLKGEALFDQARAQRLDLQMARAQVAAREALASKAISDLLPNLALIGTMAYSRGTSADNHPDPFANDPFNGFGYGFYFGFSWNVSVARLMSSPQEAQASLRKARAQLKGLEQQLKLELIERSAQVERYEATIKVRQEAMRASKTWLTASVLNKGTGVAESDTVTSALKAYAQATVAYDQAIYEYNLAVARLWLATGVDLEERLSREP